MVGVSVGSGVGVSVAVGVAVGGRVGICGVAVAVGGSGVACEQAVSNNMNPIKTIRRMKQLLCVIEPIITLNPENRQPG